MGDTLLQTDDSEESCSEEEEEIKVGTCLFDKSISGLRLRSVAFISIETSAGLETFVYSFGGNLQPFFGPLRISLSGYW